MSKPTKPVIPTSPSSLLGLSGVNPDSLDKPKLTSNTKSNPVVSGGAQVVKVETKAVGLEVKHKNTTGTPIGAVGVSEDNISLAKGDRKAMGLDKGDSKGVGLDPHQYPAFVKEKALELLWEHPRNVSFVCRAMGVHRNTWEYHLKTDPAFAQDVQNLIKAKCDELEENMAKLGSTPAYQTFNDRIAFLRAHRPELYNPARKVIVEGFKLGEGEAERRARMVGGAIEAQIVSGYTTRKERAQAKREGSSLLPSGEQEGGGGENGKV